MHAFEYGSRLAVGGVHFRSLQATSLCPVSSGRWVRRKWWTVSLCTPAPLCSAQSWPQSEMPEWQHPCWWKWTPGWHVGGIRQDCPPFSHTHTHTQYSHAHTHSPLHKHCSCLLKEYFIKRCGKSAWLGLTWVWEQPAFMSLPPSAVLSVTRLLATLQGCRSEAEESRRGI